MSIKTYKVYMSEYYRLNISREFYSHSCEGRPNVIWLVQRVHGWEGL